MEDVQIIAVRGGVALAELYKRIAEHPETGLWPVILGNAEEIEQADEAQAEGSESSILTASLAINAADWLSKTPEQRDGDEADESFPVEEGEWPEGAVEPMGIISHQDVLTGKPHNSVAIGLFPVDEPWKVFAKLGFGNWNACPAPEEHCAVHAYWGEK
jgi:hypothetical protein